MAILHLGTLLKDSFLAVLCNHELLGVLVPVDLELSDAGLFGEDVAGQARNIWFGGRCLIELGGIVLYVYIVSDAQKFLIIVVRAC
jgi:hypothetical protein